MAGVIYQNLRHFDYQSSRWTLRRMCSDICKIVKFWDDVTNADSIHDEHDPECNRILTRW